MTPKEKAKELVDKFLRIEDDTTFYWEGYYDERLKDNDVLPHAKQCALKTVGEVLYVLNEIDSTEQWNASWFYNEVKQEIEKL
jgi:hypothetical protein